MVDLVWIKCILPRRN